jgi:Holliday junction resolvase
VTTPQKAKGSQFERDVAKYFTERGFKNVERRYGAGATLDKGDINGLQHLGVIIECKNLKTITLASIVDEAVAEARNASLPYGVSVIKRRGKGAAHSYVVMELEQWVGLLISGTKR